MTPRSLRGLALIVSWAILFGTALAGPTAISGKIVEVDLHGRTLVVHDPHAGRLTVEVPESAQLVLDGDDQAILEDLFAGDRIEKGTIREGNGSRPVLVSAVIQSKRDTKDD